MIEDSIQLLITVKVIIHVTVKAAKAESPPSFITRDEPPTFSRASVLIMVSLQPYPYDRKYAHLL